MLAKATWRGRGRARRKERERERRKGRNDDECLYLNRSFELEQNGLGDENLAGLGAEIANLSLE
jgi:hypothetical protein